MNYVQLGKAVSVIHLVSYLAILGLRGYLLIVDTASTVRITYASLSFVLMLPIAVGVCGMFLENRKLMIIYACCLPLIAIKDIYTALAIFKCAGLGRYYLLFSAYVVSLICDSLVAVALTKVIAFDEVKQGKVVSTLHLVTQLANISIGSFIVILIPQQIISLTAKGMLIALLIIMLSLVGVGATGFYRQTRDLLYVYAYSLPIIAVVDIIWIIICCSIIGNHFVFLFVLAPIASLVFDVAASFAVYKFLSKHPRILDIECNSDL